MSDDEAVAWLREQISWDLDYARKNAARRPITPMRSHEMRDLIARCEAELAILSKRAAAVAQARKAVPGQPASTLNPHPRLVPGLEVAVRLLASGYRHREGWAEHWGPSDLDAAGS